MRERDQGRCARCGLAGDNWHHRRLKNIRDEHTHCTCNGIILCGSGSSGCHGWVHHHPLEARTETGLIVSRYRMPAEEPVFSRVHGWVLLRCDGGFDRTEPKVLVD